MSKFGNLVEKIYNKLVSIFPLVAVIGGFVAGFLLWALAPNEGIWGIEKESLAIAPIILPITIILAGALIRFAVELVVIIFIPRKNAQNKGAQLVLIVLFVACAVGVYFINENAWKNGYWEDATKYGNNGGIGDVIADMFEFAVNYWQVCLTTFAIELGISVALLLSLNIARKKHIRQFASVATRLLPFALVGAAIMLIVNCALYTPVTTLIFAYLLALAFVLMPSYFSVTKHTCDTCYCYKCGKTLISTTTETYVDHDDMRVVSSTDFHFDDDNTTYTVQTVAPTLKSKTTKQYRCNNCGVMFNDSAIKIIK